MSSQTTRAHAAPALLHENPDALRLTARRPTRRPRLFWALLLVGLALNAAVIALGVYLFAHAAKTVAPPALAANVDPFQ